MQLGLSAHVAMQWILSHGICAADFTMDRWSNGWERQIACFFNFVLFLMWTNCFRELFSESCKGDFAGCQVYRVRDRWGWGSWDVCPFSCLFVCALLDIPLAVLYVLNKPILFDSGCGQSQRSVIDIYQTQARIGALSFLPNYRLPVALLSIDQWTCVRWWLWTQAQIMLLWQTKLCCE